MMVVVLPTLDTPEALARVLAELPAGVPAIVVDDGSAVPLSTDRAGTRVLRHPHNRGYGAAQKSGFAAALAAGATRVVLLHGDGQYPTAPTLALAEALDHAEAVLGSRFLADPSVIPAWRRWGNRLLTSFANQRLGRTFSELHTGARAYSASALRTVDLDRLSDDFVFDQEILVALLARGGRVAERPISTRYDETTRSISFGRSIRYGLGCVRVLLSAEATRARRGR